LCFYRQNLLKIFKQEHLENNFMNTETDRIFYCWFITAAVGVGPCFGSAGSMVYAFSSFMLPLHEEFGWARRDIGLALLRQS
jgi:hypothetical protein